MWLLVTVQIIATLNTQELSEISLILARLNIEPEKYEAKYARNFKRIIAYLAW